MLTQATGEATGELPRGNVWQQVALGVIAAIVPIMVFARGVAPVLCVVLLAAFIGAASARGSTRDIVETLRGWLTRYEVRLLIAALAFLALSTLWSPAGQRGIAHATSVVVSAILIAALLASALANPLQRFAPALIGGLAVGTALLLANLLTDHGLNRLLGAAANPWTTNRAAVAIVLLLPLALVLTWHRSGLLAVGLAGLGLTAIFLSHSESAQLAALVVVVVWVVSKAAPLLVNRLTAVAIGAVMLAMPFLVGFVNDIVPEAVHEKIGHKTVTIRGELWSAYAKVGLERPLFGFGIESSNVIGETPIVAELPAYERKLLSFSHPHNAPLQIWFECGLFGVLLATALIAFAFRAIERLPPGMLSAATATAAGVFTIASVSHGAWQSWWICLVGLVAVMYCLARGPSRDIDVAS